MRKLGFPVLTIALCQPVFSQSSTIDSLKKRLQTEKKDTVRVMLLRDATAHNSRARVSSFLGTLEFLNLKLRPYIGKLTSHSPFQMLTCMVV